MDHPQNEQAAELVAQLLQRLNDDTASCPRCAADVLVEALAQLCIEGKLDPNAIAGRFMAEVWANNPRCDCDICRLEMN